VAKLSTRPLLDSAMQCYFDLEFEGRPPPILRTCSPPSLLSAVHANLKAPPSADWQGFEKLTSK
jgi:hypothetical protein